MLVNRKQERGQVCVLTFKQFYSVLTYSIFTDDTTGRYVFICKQYFKLLDWAFLPDSYI
jgi:hypothetical protein